MGRERTLYAVGDGETFTVRVARDGSDYRVESSSPPFEASVAGRAGGIWSVLIAGGSYEARVTHDNGEILVDIGGERFRFARGREALGRGPTEGARGRAEVKAPMPGKVVRLLAAAGDAVTAGQGVLLFEAMKMQNEIRSPQDGVIGELAVTEGQTVEARDVLFVVRPPA